MSLDADTCYRALAARDPRFDGLFFVGVATTGIYCRPVCTARTPGPDRCSFFRSSAEAEKSGFRACFRCRPELAPGNAEVDAVQRIVELAVASIEEGYLDDHSVDELSESLGVGARHLRRAMVDAIGVTPVELAQTCRLALAKQLLQDTSISIADVAFASGFSSVRRFNAVFRKRFAMPPSKVRRGRSGTDRLRLRLDYRPPFDWPALLAFLEARAIPGVERVDGETYRRVVAYPERGGAGVVRVALDRGNALLVEVDAELAPALTKIVARLRALFDLDARPDAIATHLREDPLLRPAVDAQPGLRVPGAFDPFETLVRTILGQQVSVRGATTLTGRLVERLGVPSEHEEGLTHVFPTARVVAATSAEDIASIGLPKKRAQTIRAVALAFEARALTPRGVDLEAFEAQLVALPGVGPWTAGYAAMRVLHHPDAFPAGDLVLEKVTGSSRAALSARAQAWRPWRAYAAMYLWSLATKERT